jgi:hypothetical protein
MLIACCSWNCFAEEVSRWMLLEGTGDSTEDAIATNDGTIYGGAVWTTGGLQFDGNDDYIFCENNDSLNIINEITVEAWIKPLNTSGISTIVRKSVNDDYQYRLCIYNGKLKGNLRLSNGAKSVVGDSTLVAGTWYHVYMTYDGATLKIYVNDYLDGSTSATGTICTSTLGLTIGRGDAYTSYFNGIIDEVRIYDHAKQSFDKEISYWTFNDGNETIAKDSTGNNDGTVYGNASWTMGALNFDGVDDYVHCGYAADLNIINEITVEAWIKPSVTSGVSTIVRKSVNDDYQYRLCLYNGKLKGNLRLSGGAKSVVGNSALVAGTWYHVYMTYDGTNLKLYINGDLDGSVSATGTICYDTLALTIGRGDAYTSYFNGIIDEVKIYNYSMTSAEIELRNYPYNKWDFIYWGLDPDLYHVTAGMQNVADDIGYWQARGVRSLHWKGGRSCAAYTQYDTIPEMSAYWFASYPQWTGITIDEFGGTGDSIDQFLGDCLVAAKQNTPNMYVAAYCIGISGSQMIAGLRKADKIQMEAYHSSSRYSYGFITNRYQKAIDNGLNNTAIIALGINSGWITTPIELRRQLHFIRYNFPNMPGIGFFNSSAAYTDCLMDEINNLLEHFYCNPVLYLEAQTDGTVKVKNIGGSSSSATAVKIIVSGNLETRNIPALNSGDSCIVAGGTNPLPVTEYTNGCYKLGPPMLYNNEPADYRPNATSSWPAVGTPSWTLNEDFSTNPIGNTEYDGSYVKTVYCPMNSTGTQNCEMMFDLSLNQTGYYGWIEIGLSSNTDDSEIRLRIYRGDYESTPRMTVYITDSTGLITSEEIAVELSGATYKIKACYQDCGYVRLALLNSSDTCLWDTGEVPVYNSVGFNQIYFSVKTSDSSTLEWDSSEQRMHLRGAFSSSYVLDAYVDNFEVYCWP